MEELTNWGEYITLFAGMFAMLNIPKNTTIFLDLTADFTRREATVTAITAALTTLAVLELFTLFGGSILAFFQITIDHVQIAGGAILLIHALSMVGVISTGSLGEARAAANPIAIGLSPLGVPLIAGPGAISTVLVYAQDHASPLHIAVVSITMLAVSVALFASLRIAVAAGNFIGPTATILINRIMGLIVAAIAVNFLVTGIKAEFGLG